MNKMHNGRDNRRAIPDTETANFTTHSVPSVATFSSINGSNRRVNSTLPSRQKHFQEHLRGRQTATNGDPEDQTGCNDTHPHPATAEHPIPQVKSATNSTHALQFSPQTGISLRFPAEIPLQTNPIPHSTNEPKGLSRCATSPASPCFLPSPPPPLPSPVIHRYTCCPLPQRSSPSPYSQSPHAESPGAQNKRSSAKSWSWNVVKTPGSDEHSSAADANQYARPIRLCSVGRSARKQIAPPK